MHFFLFLVSIPGIQQQIQPVSFTHYRSVTRSLLLQRVLITLSISQTAECSVFIISPKCKSRSKYHTQLAKMSSNDFFFFQGSLRCLSVQSASFLNRKLYGPFRCGLQNKAGISRCGLVWFSDVAHFTVRLSEIRNPTVRLGAVFRDDSKSYVALRCCDTYYPAVRCGSPLKCFCYGAASTVLGKTVQIVFSLRCTV